MKDRNQPTCQVLVVDDARSARQEMRRLLESPQCRVDTAASAEEAYAYLDATRPDIIFLDHLLPGTDGLSVLRALRDRDESASIPVVLCATGDDPELRARAREAGAAEVLPKPPPGAATLKALIARLLGPSHLQTPPPREGGLLSGLRGAMRGGSGRVAPAAAPQPAAPAVEPMPAPARPAAQPASTPFTAAAPAPASGDALRALTRRLDALQLELAGFRQEIGERLNELGESVDDLRREQAEKGMALGRAEARVDRLLQELRASLTRVADGEG